MKLEMLITFLPIKTFLKSKLFWKAFNEIFIVKYDDLKNLAGVATQINAFTPKPLPSIFYREKETKCNQKRLQDTKTSYKRVDQ